MNLRIQWARILVVMTAALFFSPVQAQPMPTLPEPAMVLNFKDFYASPVGPLGLEMSSVLHQAHGKSVVLTGYMVQQERPRPGQFMLTSRPVQMSEHADGEADDLPPATVVVILDPTQKDWAVPHVRGLIEVRGLLNVGRWEGKDNRVSWVQLQLDPQATRGMNVMEFASYIHSLQHRH